MPRHSNHFYEFGSFRLDVDRRRLLRDGTPVQVSPKSIDALIVLVLNAGKLLERETLMQAVWADTFVEDANLTVAISHLRKALGQNGEAAEYIETIPRVGYRFVAEVRETYEVPKPLIIEKHTQSRTVIEEEYLSDQTAEEASLTVSPPAPLTITRSAAIAPAYVLTASAAVLVLLLGSFFYFRHSNEKVAAAPNLDRTQIRSIAVLPPKPLTNESADASVSLGISDALITRLGSINKLTVRPTSSIARYVSTSEDALSIGRALQVDAVLDGTLQRVNGRMRVTLRLLAVSNGIQLWSNSFDESDSDVFKLEDAISTRVAGALYSNLTQTEQALLTRQQTSNKEAYALYLQGTYFWNKRGYEAAKSSELFRKAIELDPNFAQAYVNLAAVDATGADSAEAEALIEKALQLDPSSAEAHATAGFIKMFNYWDWAGAERELNLATELNPNSAVAHHWKGVYLSIRGRLDEAKAEMQHALEIDPMSLIIMTDLGQLYYFAHDYDQAAGYYNRVLGFDPEFHDAHTYLIDIYRLKGKEPEAFNEYLQTNFISPKAAASLKELFAREGLRGIFKLDVQSRLVQIKNESGQRSALALGLSRFYAYLGDNEEALKWLAVAAEKPQSFWTPYLNVDPVYDPLRSDPRFKEIISRLGLSS